MKLLVFDFRSVSDTCTRFETPEFQIRLLVCECEPDSSFTIFVIEISRISRTCSCVHNRVTVEYDYSCSKLHHFRKRVVLCETPDFRIQLFCIRIRSVCVITIAIRGNAAVKTPRSESHTASQLQQLIEI